MYVFLCSLLSFLYMYVQMCRDCVASCSVVIV